MLTYRRTPKQLSAPSQHAPQRPVCRVPSAPLKQRSTSSASTDRIILVPEQCLRFTSSAALTLLLVSGPANAVSEVFEGPARIVDGDTLYIGKDKVRLYGVDAPEKAQTCSNSRGQPYDCGKLSLSALAEHVGNRSLRCEVKNKDQYGRNVAACYLGAGPIQEDIGQWLVSNGLAVAYRAYSSDYIVAEEKAHARHLGVWQGNFTMPAKWRKQQPSNSGDNSSSMSSIDSQDMSGSQNAWTAAVPLLSSNSSVANGLSYAAVVAGLMQAPAAAPVGAPPLCNGPVIKGNINAKGEKIYHTVKSGSYERVQIELDKGERFFCTEDEALAAGWRSALK